MDNKTEETTKSDSSEPIVSWSGVQGETQSEDVEIPNEEEVMEDGVGANAPTSDKPAS